MNCPAIFNYFKGLSLVIQKPRVGNANISKFHLFHGSKCRSRISTNMTLIVEKSTLARRPVKVHYPAGEPTKLEKKSIDLKTTNAASIFNLTMGEVMMSKSQKQKRIAVEGVRLIDEAVKAGLQLEMIFVSKGELPLEINNFLKGEGKFQENSRITAEIHRVNSKLMQTWSSVTTPPGIIAIFQKRKPKDILPKLELIKDSIPLTVICDNIREPGNLGSILRSAAGAGCKQVLLTAGCVDPWNMKVLRGGCGAHFYIPIIQELNSESLEQYVLKETEISESERINGKISSLDTLKNSRNNNKVAIFLADNNITDSRIDVPSISYTKVEYANYRHLFLVIGGETEGISNELTNLTKNVCKISTVVPLRLRVPLAFNINSLNAANAFGVLVFEMRRQLMIEKEK